MGPLEGQESGRVGMGGLEAALTGAQCVVWRAWRWASCCTCRARCVRWTPKKGPPQPDAVVQVYHRGVVLQEGACSGKPSSDPSSLTQIGSVDVVCGSDSFYPRARQRYLKDRKLLYAKS